MPPWRCPSLNHQVISDGPHVALGKIKTKIKEELSYCDHIQQVLILFLSLPSYLNGPGYVFFGAALSNKWLNSCYLCSFFKNPFKMANACNYNVSLKTNRQVTAHRATEKAATNASIPSRKRTNTWWGGEGDPLWGSKNLLVHWILGLIQGMCTDTWGCYKIPNFWATSLFMAPAQMTQTFIGEYKILCSWVSFGWSETSKSL